MMGYGGASWNYSVAGVISYMDRQEEKDPDLEHYLVTNDMMDILVEYFEQNAVYEGRSTDLNMFGQLKFRGKPVIAIG